MNDKQYGLNKGLAQMLKGGVIMDVTTPEQAKIAEAAGACAVMALERISAADENVQILTAVDGNTVAVRYKNQIGLAFHPELTDDTRIHALFLNLVNERLGKA